MVERAALFCDQSFWQEALPLDREWQMDASYSVEIHNALAWMSE
jgi:hypothetical protein